MPEVVGADIAGDLVHRLPDAHLGGEVDDAVDALQRPVQRIAVADVAADQLGALRRQPHGVLVDLRHEGVEQPDGVAAGDQLVGDVAADKAGASGDEGSGHWAGLF